MSVIHLAVLASRASRTVIWLRLWHQFGIGGVILIALAFFAVIMLICWLLGRNEEDEKPLTPHSSKADTGRRWGVCPECGGPFDNDQGRCENYCTPKQPVEEKHRPLAEPVRFPMASTGKKWTRCPGCGLQYVGEKGSCPTCSRSNASSQPGSTTRQGPAQ